MILEDVRDFKIDFKKGNAQLTDVQKAEIKKLYTSYISEWNYSGGCGNCYVDAIMELKYYLKKISNNNDLNYNFMTNFRLKPGTIIRFHGESKFYTVQSSQNDLINLLRRNGAFIDKFEEYPENWEEIIAAPRVFEKPIFSDSVLGFSVSPEEEIKLITKEPEIEKPKIKKLKTNKPRVKKVK